MRTNWTGIVCWFGLVPLMLVTAYMAGYNAASVETLRQKVQHAADLLELNRQWRLAARGMVE